MNSNYFIEAYRKISTDKRAQLSHIVLYVNLLTHWQEQAFQNPMIVSRKRLMPTARIKSKVTYHKCIKELDAFGYIEYEPSYNPGTATRITIMLPQEEAIENTIPSRKEIPIRFSIEAEQT